MNGVILYEGKSAIDNQSDIVVIATGLKNPTKNPKTGNMIQVWILLKDVDPASGLNGADYAICGNCPHRKNLDNGKRTCYVNIMGPNSVYRSYKKGNYEYYHYMRHGHLFKQRYVRWGAYGDPVNIPLEILQHFSEFILGHTGYTHQWKHAKFADYKQYFQASVDNVYDYLTAQNAGWGTFRVSAVGVIVNTLEVKCQGGIKTDCAKCLLCSGSGDRATSIVIEAHGSNAKLVVG